jgi:hypothetical protein
MLILLYVAITYPLNMAFPETEIISDQVNFILGSIISFLFFIDIILTFFTSMTDEEDPNLEITDLKKIAIDYVKHWFFIDVVSTFPIDMFFESNGST